MFFIYATYVQFMISFLGIYERNQFVSCIGAKRVKKGGILIRVLAFVIRLNCSHFDVQLEGCFSVVGVVRSNFFG